VNSRSVLVSFLCMFALACGKTEAGGGGAAPAPASSGGGSSTTLTLPKVGDLKIDVPAGASVNDGVVTGNMVMGPGIVVNVEYASDSRPKTADEAKTEASDFTPKNLKTEALSDGWLVSFDNSGSMGKNFFVQVRRTIGGKAVWCETTASQQEQADNAIKACKSIKP